MEADGCMTLQLDADDKVDDARFRLARLRGCGLFCCRPGQTHHSLTSTVTGDDNDGSWWQIPVRRCAG